MKTDRRDTLLARQNQQGPGALGDALLPLVQDLITQVTTHRATLTA